MTNISIPKLDSVFDPKPHDMPASAGSLHRLSPLMERFTRCQVAQGVEWQGCSRNGPIKQQHPNNSPFFLPRIASHPPPALAFSLQPTAAGIGTLHLTDAQTKRTKKHPMSDLTASAALPRTFP